MNKVKKDTRWLTSVALMAAVVILLANTPLGMIQLPIIKATTVHIPVILGAILLGPMAGAILGAVFGVCSLISNTVTPTLLSFAFSPFMSMTGMSGAVKAVWISVGCRMMIGIISGWFWILVKKCKLNHFIALPIAREYAQARNVGVEAVFGLVMGTVTASGIPEAIAAAVLVAVIGKVLLKVVKRV